MKKFLIYLLFISTIFSQNRNLDRNIDQFKIDTFTRPIESGLVEVMCFVKIPNYSLQFVCHFTLYFPNFFFLPIGSLIHLSTAVPFLLVYVIFTVGIL